VNEHSDIFIAVAGAPHDIDNGMEPGMIVQNIEALREKLADIDEAEERADLLLDLSALLVSASPADSLAPAMESLKIARALGDPRRAIAAHALVARCKIVVNDLAAARRHAGRGVALLAGHPDHDREAALIHNEMGSILASEGNYQGSFELCLRALDRARLAGDARLLAGTLITAGDLSRTLGDYAGALEYLMEGKGICEEIGDRFGLARAHNNMAIVHSLLQDLEMARAIGDRGLTMSREIGWRGGELNALLNLAGILIWLEEPGLAGEYYLTALEIARELRNDRLEIYALDGYAQICIVIGDYDGALENFRKVVAMSEELGRADALALSLKGLGRAYAYKSIWDKSIEHLRRSLAIYREMTHRHGECDLLKIIAEVYEAAGQHACALEYIKLFIELKDELVSQSVNRRVAEIQRRAEVEKAEREKELYMLRARQLEMDVEHRNRELASLALRLVQKNEVIRKLRGEVIPFMMRVGREALDVASDMIGRIGDSDATGGDWESFERQFHLVNHEDGALLRSRCPDLTPTETKICTLLKIGLASKEIASLLSISVHTVETHRRRIRKKLRLPADASLSSYLAGLAPAAP
jgi:DNA-binding CsgD family transcriptional regulator/tetratricopeptide (TPR) repeat protein